MPENSLIDNVIARRRHIPRVMLPDDDLLADLQCLDSHLGDSHLFLSGLLEFIRRNNNQAKNVYLRIASFELAVNGDSPVRVFFPFFSQHIPRFGSAEVSVLVALNKCAERSAAEHLDDDALKQAALRTAEQPRFRLFVPVKENEEWSIHWRYFDSESLSKPAPSDRVLTQTMWPYLESVFFNPETQHCLFLRAGNTQFFKTLLTEQGYTGFKKGELVFAKAPVELVAVNVPRGNLLLPSNLPGRSVLSFPGFFSGSASFSLYVRLLTISLLGMRDDAHAQVLPQNHSSTTLGPRTASALNLDELPRKRMLSAEKGEDEALFFTLLNEWEAALGQAFPDGVSDDLLGDIPRPK